MPLSVTARQRARSFLTGDDDIRYIFPADILLSANPSVIVVVSCKAITILFTGLLSRKKPRTVLATLPRTTRLAPVDMQATPYFTVDAIDYEIDEEYVTVVHAADLEIASSEAIPDDPLPDL